MNDFLKLIGLLVLGGITIALNGIAGSWLWFWFLVPFGLPVIGIIQAMGVSLALRFFVTNPRIEKKSEEVDLNQKVVFAVLYPIIALGFGWLIHSFM